MRERDELTVAIENITDPALQERTFGFVERLHQKYPDCLRLKLTQLQTRGMGYAFGAAENPWESGRLTKIYYTNLADKGVITPKFDGIDKQRSLSFKEVVASFAIFAINVPEPFKEIRDMFYASLKDLGDAVVRTQKRLGESDLRTHILVPKEQTPPKPIRIRPSRSKVSESPDESDIEESVYEAIQERPRTEKMIALLEEWDIERAKEFEAKIRASNPFEITSSGLITPEIEFFIQAFLKRTKENFRPGVDVLDYGTVASSLSILLKSLKQIKKTYKNLAEVYDSITRS